MSLVPGRHHSVLVGGIIQESLGGIIPLQTGGFAGIGKAVEKRFGLLRAPEPIEMLTDNGAPYTAKDT